MEELSRFSRGSQNEDCVEKVAGPWSALCGSRDVSGPCPLRAVLENGAASILFPTTEVPLRPRPDLG